MLARVLSGQGPVVAILNFNLKSISRGRGSSAVSSAAYIARTKLRDERLNRTFDFRSRGGLTHSEIVLPQSAPAAARSWATDRSTLWNTAERAEKRANARVAREYVVALPAELTAEKRLALAQGFAQRIADRYGVAADLAVHDPPPGGDPRNVHAHVLATTRSVEREGLGAKTFASLPDERRRERGHPSAREEIRLLRHDWAAQVNDALREAGLEVTVDARSYWERGINQVGTPQLSREITMLERRGIVTEVGERRREEHRERNRIMQELTAAAAARHPTAVPDVRHPAPATEQPLEAAMPGPVANAPEARPGAIVIDEQQRRAVERWRAFRRDLEAGKSAAAGATKSKERDLGADFGL